MLAPLVAAAAIAGLPVQCQDIPWLGYYDTEKIVLRADQCESFSRLRGSPTRGKAIALFVFAHELGHHRLFPNPSEDEATRFAHRQFPYLAQRLGVKHRWRLYGLLPWAKWR